MTCTSGSVCSCDAGYIQSEESSVCVLPAFTIDHCIVSKQDSLGSNYICALCESGFHPVNGGCSRRLLSASHPQPARR